MSTNIAAAAQIAESQIAEPGIVGWFCIYCEEDFDTETQVDLHLAGDNRCSKINDGRKKSKLVQDTENPNHYYTVFNEHANDHSDFGSSTSIPQNKAKTDKYKYNETDNDSYDSDDDDDSAADEHVVSKSNDTFNKINDLIWSGFSLTMSIKDYSRNTSNAYTKIKELLQDTKNTLSQKEVQDLRETYSFITKDVHGYYPSDDCHMFNMLRTATII